MSAPKYLSRQISCGHCDARPAVITLYDLEAGTAEYVCEPCGELAVAEEFEQHHA